MLFYLLDLFGVAVLAISGALVAMRRSMDVLGVIVIATVTARGGRALRRRAPPHPAPRHLCDVLDRRSRGQSAADATRPPHRPYHVDRDDGGIRITPGRDRA